MPATLAAGTIHGYCVGEPWNQQAVFKGIGVPVVTDYHIWKNNPEAVYVTAGEALFEKSFLVSAITVTLCSLWSTLINTAVGVSSVPQELLNVTKVLQLRWHTTVAKIIISSALPFIFTGMRLSLGVGW
jgi:ABC-type anion transport system duplicated permease subunit